MILKTAVAHTAWEERQRLTDRDIIVAAELALPHRLKRRPFDEVQTSIEQLDKMVAMAREHAEETQPKDRRRPCMMATSRARVAKKA